LTRFFNAFLAYCKIDWIYELPFPTDDVEEVSLSGQEARTSGITAFIGTDEVMLGNGEVLSICWWLLGCC
jgi:hypothetical protein